MWPFVDLPLFGRVVPYDVVRYAAVAACIVLASFLNRRRGISVSVTVGIALLCVPFAVWGARALDVLEYRSIYGSFGDALGRPGSSIYGGLLTAFAVVPVLTRVFRVPALAYLDGAAPPLALGEALTRLGCFAAGCCYGVPWEGPWAVTFPPGSLAFSDLVKRGLLDASALHTQHLHPVQLYPVVLMSCVTVWLVRRHGRRPPDGQLLALFLVAYGAQRLLFAPLRMEYLVSMRAFSLLFIASGLVGLLLIRRRGWAPTPVAAGERVS